MTSCGCCGSAGASAAAGDALPLLLERFFRRLWCFSAGGSARVGGPPCSVRGSVRLTAPMLQSVDRGGLRAGLRCGLDRPAARASLLLGEPEPEPSETEPEPERTATPSDLGDLPSPGIELLNLPTSALSQISKDENKRSQ